jgi:hypothetical protein
MEKNSYSNFITPPDFTTDNFHTVLLVDVSWEDVEKLALYCKSSEISFNVYLYDSTMADVDWFMLAHTKADAVIINSTPSEFSHIKDKLAIADNAYYYGDKNFLMNTKRINDPIDYFIQYTTKTLER